MIYLIADTHFGHANILRPDYANRPFRDVHEMDEAMIERWNARVGDDDAVIVAGDFSHYSRKLMRQLVTERLHGSKILVIGDNDGTAAKMHDVGFRDVHKRLELGTPYGRVLVIHDPWEAFNARLDERFDLVLHGHIHQRHIEECEHWKARPGADPSAYVNISAEHVAYAPCTLDEVVAARHTHLKGIQHNT